MENGRWRGYDFALSSMLHPLFSALSASPRSLRLRGEFSFLELAMKQLSKAVRDRAQRVATILPILKKTYPEAKCSLDHRTPLELLVATILSAQCTDDRVNIVTKSLFQKYRSAKDYAAVPQDALERDIQSTGFYRNKAKSI